MKNVVMFLICFLILNPVLIMAEDVPTSFSKEDIKEFIAIMNELESSAQKAQAEAERAALEKRKQEEIARIEIEAARAKARQALIEQKNKEREERLKLKEADHKLALEKESKKS